MYIRKIIWRVRRSVALLNTSRQLSYSTKWSKRSKRMSTKELAKIVKGQTVMVMCHQ